MGVRFFCPNCHCVLLIASRKAGTEIRCPRCDQTQTVPAESNPLAVIAGRHAASTSGPGGSAKPPVDAEGMILNWIEGDDPSTEHAQAFDATVHDVRSIGPSHFPPVPGQAAPPTPRPSAGSTAGEVAFEEVPAAAQSAARPADRAPPTAPLAAPPIVHTAPSDEQPASRLWLVLLTLGLFTAAVAGAFIAGYIMGRQSNVSPNQQESAPHASARPIGSVLST